MPFWSWLSKKLGARLSWIIALLTWIACLSPLMFISTPAMGFVVFGLIGFGMGGSLLNKDIIFGQIIDHDEVTTGVRREASYFGIDNFFSRLATVLVFVSIGAVFANDAVGWTIFDPAVVTDATRFGIKTLMFILPAIALAIGVIFMLIYPLHGKKLEDLNVKLKELHEQKKQDTRAN
jgi:GPH family glycoside/pentoside/hexuronide:cation symporter